MAKATSASIDVRIVILPQPSLRSMSMDIGREDLTPIIANEENQMIIDETMVDEAMLDAENSPTEEYYQDDILVTTHRTEESIFIQFTKTE
ncbi:MAG: hypothetical protein KJ957_01365 [Candidatus Omnitrophica bacterium]|nr:hypothetical protein [Candidatus Omnitrophota bacterium]